LNLSNATPKAKKIFIKQNSMEKNVTIPISGSESQTIQLIA
jgi:hypothetical protein